MRLTILTAFLLLPLLARAVPYQIHYQGQLFLAGGSTPVPDSTGNSMEFRIVDSGGNTVWAEIYNAGSGRFITTRDGLFSVALGQYNPLTPSALTDADYRLRVTPYSNGLAEAPLSPDQKLASAPFAIFAERLGDKKASDIASLETSVSQHSTRISSAESDINALGTTQANHVTRIASLESASSSYATQTQLSSSLASYLPLAGGTLAGNLAVTGNAGVGGDLSVSGQVKGLTIENLAAAPASPTAGRTYFDTVTKSLWFHDGSQWCYAGPRLISSKSATADNTEADSGVVRSMGFTKKFASSRLRIHYCDNFRLLNASGFAVATWEVKMDGSPMPVEALKTSVYIDNGNKHLPACMTGMESGVGAGAHTLSVSVSCSPGDAYTGWESTYYLEVEELP